MKITVNNQFDQPGRLILVKRVWVTEGSVMHLTQQFGGHWHLIMGKQLVPRLSQLKSIQISGRVGSKAIAHFVGGGGEMEVGIRYEEADKAFMHFDCLRDGSMVLILSQNFLADGDWPASLHFEP